MGAKRFFKDPENQEKFRSLENYFRPAAIFVARGSLPNHVQEAVSQLEGITRVFNRIDTDLAKQSSFLSWSQAKQNLYREVLDSTFIYDCAAGILMDRNHAEKYRIYGDGRSQPERFIRLGEEVKQTVEAYKAAYGIQ